MYVEMLEVSQKSAEDNRHLRQKTQRREHYSLQKYDGVPKNLKPQSSTLITEAGGPQATFVHQPLAPSRAT